MTTIHDGGIDAAETLTEQLPLPPPPLDTEDAGADGTDGTDAFFSDDVLPPPRRRRLGALTATLILLLVAGLGVLGGVQLQKHEAGSSTTASSGFPGAAAFAAGGRGGLGGGGQAGSGQGGGGQAGGGRTIGTVKLVDGTNVYVSTTDGTIVKVTTDGSTTITKSASAQVSDLSPGQNVIVQGTANADGTVAATTVTDAPGGGGETPSGAAPAGG